MIEELTYQQQNNQLAIKQAKAAYHYAVVQNECYREFWNRDPQMIVDSLNGNIALTMERFVGNTTLGNAVNAQLSHTQYAARCIVTMPHGYSYDSTEFVYAPPVIPEPQPEP